VTGPDGGARGTAASWLDLAREAARRGGGAAERVEQQKLLAFRLGDTPYAVPVESVREIVRIRPLTPVPRLPADVRGVISLRGEIVEVVDLRRRLGLPALDLTRASRIVIVHGGEGQVAGLLVDSVSEVISVSEDAIRPASGDADAVEALCERDGRFVSLIDLERVLDVHAER
jgi:purine-binding chemotaxis protein CheW